MDCILEITARVSICQTRYSLQVYVPVVCALFVFRYFTEHCHLLYWYWIVLCFSDVTKMVCPAAHNGVCVDEIEIMRAGFIMKMLMLFALPRSGRH